MLIVRINKIFLGHEKCLILIVYVFSTFEILNIIYEERDFLFNFFFYFLHDFWIEVQSLPFPSLWSNYIIAALTPTITMETNQKLWAFAKGQAYARISV